MDLHSGGEGRKGAIGGGVGCAVCGGAGGLGGGGGGGGVGGRCVFLPRRKSVMRVPGVLPIVWLVLVISDRVMMPCTRP